MNEETKLGDIEQRLASIGLELDRIKALSKELCDGCEAHVTKRVKDYMDGRCFFESLSTTEFKRISINLKELVSSINLDLLDTP